MYVHVFSSDYGQSFIAWLLAFLRLIRPFTDYDRDNMAGVVHQAGDAYLSGAPGLTFNSLEVHVFSVYFIKFDRIVRTNEYCYMDVGTFAFALMYKR